MNAEERVSEILADWSEQRDQGRCVDPEELILQYPDLADDLRDGFAALEFVDLALGVSPSAPDTPRQIGAYEIAELLGVGGMGTVYLAEAPVDRTTGDEGGRVALKVIHSHLLRTPGFFKRFLREADIGCRIRHENVVRTFDVDAIEQDGVPYHFIVMEYVHGQTLRDLLKELGRVPEELCRHIGLEVARGLAAIHEAGAVHRDLKPENVLITDDHQVKVMDLGVAHSDEERMKLSQTGVFIGSLLYAAPEQISGSSPDGRADLYALGVLLYELATGAHPYGDEDPSQVLRNVLDVTPRRAGEVNPQLSPFLEEVLHALIAKDVDERFDSASDLTSVLKEGERSDWWKERAKAVRLETRRPLRRIRVPRETGIYGRDDELRRLYSLFSQAQSGVGQVLLIEGEAGIGKTRVVDEFVGRLRERGEDVNFLFGSYPPGGAATASGAFSEAYREQFGAAGLEETLQEYLTLTPSLIPAFAAVLRGETTPKGAEALTNDSLQTVFVHATRGLANERPTVVLIDDLHFAPEDGRALFASLALAVPDHRLLLIGTLRPGVPESWTASIERLEHAQRLLLPRLGPKHLSLLLREAFRSERLADELGWRIAQKSDGNPFFAFEIIRGLREGQFITQQPDGTWVTTRVIQDIQVPSSIQDLVHARVADLSEEDRDLLEVASCCGFEFDPVVVAEAAGLARIPALKRFGQVERRHRLIRSIGRKLAFDHHQVQETLYAGILEALREEYHVAIAETLEAQMGAKDREPSALEGAKCVELTEHFLRGANGERALRYMEPALDHLVAGYLNDQAIALADRALRVPELLQGQDRLRVLLVKNLRLGLLGRRESQKEVLNEATALAGEGDDKRLVLKVLQQQAVLCINTSAFKEARELLVEILQLSRDLGDRVAEGKALLSLGNTLASLGQLDDARASLSAARDLFEEICEREGEATAVGNLGVVSKLGGQYEEAQGLYERHLRLAQRIGDREGEARAAGNLGGLLHLRGRYGQAGEYYERNLEIAREIGERQSEVVATGNSAILLLNLGDYRAAQGLFEKASSLAREVGDEVRENLNLQGLGALWLRLGAIGRARDTLESSAVRLKKLANPWAEAHALRHLAEVADEEGDLARAVDLAGKALAVCRSMGDSGGVADSLLQLGELYRRLENLGAAAEALREAGELFRQQCRREELSLALALSASLPGGDVGPAELHLCDLAASEQATKARLWFWRSAQSREHLEQAKQFVDHAVTHAPEEYRESMLTNVRLHREIVEAWEANP